MKRNQFEFCSAVLIICVLALLYPVADSFNVGVRATACSLEQSSYNDPCKSLYDAECDGAHCKCPSGTHEDKGLKRCVRGPARGGGGGDFDDLPFDYVPGQKPQPKPKPKTPSTPVQPPPPPRQPNVPAQPQQPVEGGYRPGGYNPNNSGYGKYPNQPGYNPNQRGNSHNYPGQPGVYPQQPYYPNPNNPYYDPNQPGYNPNQPGYTPNQPGYYPEQPGGHNPNHPGRRGRGRGDPHIGEKAGGGIGGGLGLLIVAGLFYFCCCRGEKGQNLRSKLPFFKGAQPSTNYQMQQPQPGQYPNAPQPAAV